MNSGLPGMDPEAPQWSPANQAETAMYAAMIAGDDSAYTTALVTATLLLPVTEEAAEGHEDPRWATYPTNGVTYLLAFTSPEAISVAFPCLSTRYRVTDFFDLVRHWPDRDWVMAVNPGLPIASQLTFDVLRQLAEAGPPRTPRPDNLSPAEERLWTTLMDGDRPEFLATLVRQPLLLVLAPDAGPSRDITDPDFSWYLVENELGEPGLPVFTSQRLLKSVLGDWEFIELSVPQLVENWPDENWNLMVNPDTGLATRITGAEAKDLGSWIGSIRETLNTRVAEYNERVTQEHLRALAGQDPHVPFDAEPPEEADLAPDPDLPLVLQLVIPHTYLNSYLEQGYNRAAGLVHAWRGKGRETPASLYRRLGLLGSGSPFAASDEWVAVLRWLPDAETPESWGRDEPSMESVLIPDGAEIHRVNADGAEECLARFDERARRWTPPPSP